MGNKVDYQHAQGNEDGKTFPAQSVPTSPEFGQCDRDYQVVKGNVPGSPQWEPLVPDPEIS